MKALRNPQKNSKRIPTTLVSTATPLVTNHVYYFGSFCLDPAERQLLRNGEPIRLTPKAFDVLLALIQNQGCLVTKERLLEEVWPDVFVEEANLSVNIASLRKVLDEGDAARQSIETVPKRGYRFVAHVSGLLCESHRIDSQEDCRRNEVLKSLAILPFQNEGCGPAGEYLSDGLMGSITNTLSQSRELRIMAPHIVYSHHRCNVDPRTIGQELGVDSVLLGRILQLGEDLIVRTELIDVMNGWQLWGEQYDTRVSDILIVQQELTAKISERLRIRLSVDRLDMFGQQNRARPKYNRS